MGTFSSWVGRAALQQAATTCGDTRAWARTCRTKKQTLAVAEGWLCNRTSAIP